MAQTIICQWLYVRKKLDDKLFLKGKEEQGQQGNLFSQNNEL